VRSRLRLRCLREGLSWTSWPFFYHERITDAMGIALRRRATMRDEFCILCMLKVKILPDSMHRQKYPNVAITGQQAQ
jgi:hypothetical protein